MPPDTPAPQLAQSLPGSAEGGLAAPGAGAWPVFIDSPEEPISRFWEVMAVWPRVRRPLSTAWGDAAVVVATGTTGACCWVTPPDFGGRVPREGADSCNIKYKPVAK